jgi:hypothetical protein
MWTSVPHNDVAFTRITASCGPGEGSGHVVAVNPGSGAVLTSARMVPLYPTHCRLPNVDKNTVAQRSAA